MSSNRIVLLLFLVALLGLGLRLYYAYQVFPVRSDAGNFVQFGVAYAQGVRPQLSGFWALAPQHIVTLATRANLDPLRTLQLSTVLFGGLAILGTGAMGWGLTGRPVVGLLAAIFAATNYALVDLSTTGLSEPGYLAFLLCGGAIWILGVRRESRIWIGAGAFTMGLALFFKPYETYIFFAICLFVQSATMFLGGRIRAFVPILMVSCLSFLPPWTAYYTAVTRLGIESAHQTKLYNFIHGVTGLDSKIYRAGYGLSREDNPLQIEKRLIEEKGAIGYLWYRRGEILSNYSGNLAQSARILNNHLFFGAFRMGFAWFLLVAILVGVSLMRQRLILAMGIPALMAAAIPVLLALAAAHGRWLIQCVPFLLILLAAGLTPLLVANQAAWMRRITVGVLALFVIVNGKNSAVFAGDHWKTNNYFPVTERLRTLASEDDRVMAFNIPMMMAFYRTNTFNVVNMPYATAAETAALADLRGARWVVYSDSQFAHYPIHQVSPESPEWPEQWTLVTNLVFSHYTRFGYDEEVFSIVRVDRP